MKNSILLLLLFLCVSIFASAQAPSGINYQAVIRDGTGAPMVNKSVTLRLSLLEGSSTGTDVYVETHNLTTSSHGLINTVLGKGAVTKGTFSALNWGTNSYFLKVEADNGSGYVDMGTEELMSVPYALAANSEWVTSPDSIFSKNTGKVIIGRNSNETGVLRLESKGPNTGVEFQNTTGNNTNAASIYLKNSGSNDRSMQFLVGNPSATSSSDEFIFRNFGRVHMSIKNNGYVGINTTSPSYYLHVNGAAGKPGGGSWTAASDRRLKQGIVSYSDGLQSLMQIEPVKYKYNDKSGFDTNKEYVGVIAQDLQQVAPYMVGTFTKDGETYYDVDNSAMVYMLINAVKEQQATIADMQKEINELKTKVK